MTDQPRHEGGCLCGAIRLQAAAPAENPHTCSCRMCQSHSGTPLTIWVEFSSGAVRWTGAGGRPALFRSSRASCRAFCPQCGSSIGAIDDDGTTAILVGVLDDMDRPDLVPKSHSFTDCRPGWWRHITCEE